MSPHADTIRAAVAGDDLADPWRRAVRGGVMPGIFNVRTEHFYALSWSREAIGCPECWAGLSHTGPGWETFHRPAEHTDTAGCCECGSTHHVCQECPTFDGPADKATTP